MSSKKKVVLLLYLRLPLSYALRLLDQWNSPAFCLSADRKTDIYLERRLYAEDQQSCQSLYLCFLWRLGSSSPEPRDRLVVSESLLGDSWRGYWEYVCVYVCVYVHQCLALGPLASCSQSMTVTLHGVGWMIDILHLCVCMCVCVCALSSENIPCVCGSHGELQTEVGKLYVCVYVCYICFLCV